PGHPVRRGRADRACRLLRPSRIDPGRRAGQVLVASKPLSSVTAGLMIWTIVCFLIALWVLKRYAFGPIQRLIDQRQESIRHSIEAADDAREEAQRLLGDHTKLVANPLGHGDAVLAEAGRPPGE